MQKNMKVPNIMDCPGAWYGSQPEPWHYGNTGHIVIDPKQIEPALKWFRRHFFYVARDVTTDRGILFDLTIKPQ